MKWILLALLTVVFSCNHFETKADVKKGLLSDDYKKTVISFPRQSVEETTKILKNFSQTCLNMKATSYMGTGQINGGVQGAARFDSSLIPEMVIENKSPVLYLRKKEEASNTVEIYILVVKILSEGAGSRAEIYHRDYWGSPGERFSQRAVEWLKKEKQLCPLI